MDLSNKKEKKALKYVLMGIGILALDILLYVVISDHVGNWFLLTGMLPAYIFWMKVYNVFDDKNKNKI